MPPAAALWGARGVKPVYYINPARYRELFARLKAIGRDRAGAMQRVAWGEDELTARRWLAEFLAGEGLTVTVDGAGNVWGEWVTAPGRPYLVMGSHLDTVPGGGAYDGALGVVGAVEALLSVRERQPACRYNLAVVGWADEEGVRFGGGLYGSRAVAGEWTYRELVALKSADGQAFVETVKPLGVTPESVLSAARRDIALYFELHVEQGPVLAQAGIPVGVVTRVVGRRQGALEIAGVTNHAGTTPMADRQDALVSAADAILALRRVAAEREAVGTVGEIQVSPGVSNVIPGHARITFDIRAPFDEVVSGVYDAWQAELSHRGIPLEPGPLYREPSVAMDPVLQGVIKARVTEMGRPVRELPSWAVHDAMVMARHVPTAMIFVPSAQGISHARDEFTPEERCIDGVEALYRTVWTAATDNPEPLAPL